MIVYECQNCGMVWEDHELNPLPEHHVCERVAPGEPMPAGECPDCGAVCHAEKTPYNHAFSIGFEVISREEDPSHVTEAEMIKGLIKTILNLLHSENGISGVAEPFDTMRANA